MKSKNKYLEKYLALILLILAFGAKSSLAQNNPPTCTNSPTSEVGKISNWDNCVGQWSRGDSSYLGEWQRGEMHGQGIRTFAGNDRYIGEFKRSLFSGKGIFIFGDGRPSLEGNWSQNNFVSSGRLIPNSLLADLAIREKIDIIKLNSVIPMGTVPGFSIDSTQQVQRVTEEKISEKELQRLALDKELKEQARIDQDLKQNEKIILLAEQKANDQRRLIEEASLKEQQRLTIEAQQKEQIRLLAEQKANDQRRLIEEARLKDQQRLALEAQQKEQVRISLELKQKDQERLYAEQKANEQLITAEAKARANAVELAKLKEELTSMRFRKEDVVSEPTNRKALVIGNDNYSSVPKLANARQDANAVGKTLSELGYKVMVKNDLNEKDMKATLRQFKNDLDGGDEVVIFYAGHGVQLGAANYLLPTDIKGESEDQVRDDAIQLQRLLDDMNEKRVKFTLAMIDACRDNPFPKSGRAIGGRGLAPTTAATGQMIIFSAGSGQQALDKLGPNDKNPNGLFTRMLLSEIRKQGVRVDNMIRDVRRKVVDAARSVGHEQVPAIYDQVVGDFYFNK